MSWNYRVIVERNTPIEGEDSYALAEVFYDKRGKIRFWTAPGMNPHGTTIKELKQDLRYMSQALKQPILERKDGKLRKVK